MARIPRKLTVIDGYQVHKVWRSHNKEFNLQSDDDKRAYLSYLNQELESKRFNPGARLEALTLMGNHVHELFKVLAQPLFSNLMRRHHSRYGMYFNRRHDRRGKVAQDRPHTTLVESDFHQMVVVFYIHANPIRANLIGDASRYFWSTHKLYAFGRREAWMKNVKLPQWYIELGPNDKIRQRRYRKLFADYLLNEELAKKSFSKCRFYGDIGWCTERNLAVRQWRMERKTPP